MLDLWPDFSKNDKFPFLLFSDTIFKFLGKVCFSKNLRKNVKEKKSRRTKKKERK